MLEQLVRLLTGSAYSESGATIANITFLTGKSQRLLQKTHLLRYAANIIAQHISICASRFGFCDAPHLIFLNSLKQEFTAKPVFNRKGIFTGWNELLALIVPTLRVGTSWVNALRFFPRGHAPCPLEIERRAL